MGMLDFKPPKKNLIDMYGGVIPYQRALELQRKLWQARIECRIPDVLLLLQHPPVFTIGRFRGEEHIMISPNLLAQKGIPLYHTDRGGSVTYHGPGQLVGYPIIHLQDKHISVREYIWKLEEVIIETLCEFSLHGSRSGQYPGGVWVGDKKICSIGIRIHSSVTTHGFALNVNNDLDNFRYIRPCGLKSDMVTSIAELLHHEVDMASVIQTLRDSFQDVFGHSRCEVVTYG